MSTISQLTPDELYQRGLQHFHRAEWHDAITAFTELQASGEAFPGVEDLIADARVKLIFESVTPPDAKMSQCSRRG